MSETNRRDFINIENTRFIWKTNFSGDPARDSFGSDERKASIIIPSEEQAIKLKDMGFKVKTTKPRDGEEDDFEPKYYVSVKVNYNSDWPPKVYLVSGNSPARPLDEEDVSILDSIYVLNVNAVLSPYHNKKTGTMSLYVRTLYVEQDVDEDPYADRYRGRTTEREF